MSFLRATTTYFAVSYRQYALLFVVAAVLFMVLHADLTFADPDSFYHAKMAELLAERGAVKSFPWLAATNLATSFTDHHFLYHLLLIPFTTFLPPLLGLKVATVFFASAAVVVIFWFLRSLGVWGAFWYSLFLLTVAPFVFRLGLAKAQALALVVVFLTLYFVITRRELALVVVGALGVWLYAGWPLLIVLTVLYAGVRLVPFLRRNQGQAFFSQRHVFWQGLGAVVSVGLGSAFGLALSPYFPGNLGFYYQQSVKIALVNYQHLISVGAEWYPYGWATLFQDAAPLFILAFVAFVAFSFSFKKQSLHTWFFLIASIIFLLFTFKSKRFVEYFVPFAVCFSALALTGFFRLYGKRLVAFFPRYFGSLFPLVLLLAFAPTFYRDLGSVKEFYRNGFAFDRFVAPSAWLASHSLPGDIVFHSDWDEFPILFYHNNVNYYLVGLDPSFMYEYDQTLHLRWVNAVTGQAPDQLYDTIKTLFGARYVFVDHIQNQVFDQQLSASSFFDEMFRDDQVSIYRVVW